MTSAMRVLLVDDEPHARAGMAALLKRAAGFVVVAQCGDGAAAVKAIAETEPDLVLLDVQMPEMSGFDVVRAVGVDQMPATIFVTAHENHALEAFRVAALDYVLKPFDDRRMLEALERARVARAERRYSDLGRRLLTLVSADSTQPEVRFAVRTGNRTMLVGAEEVEWIEAASYYARLHVGKECYLIRETMSSLESRLDHGRFVRTHRSAIVQLRQVVSLERRRLGDHLALLRSGARVPVARNRWIGLEKVLAASGR